MLSFRGVAKKYDSFFVLMQFLLHVDIEPVSPHESHKVEMNFGIQAQLLFLSLEKHKKRYIEIICSILSIPQSTLCYVFIFLVKYEVEYWVYDLYSER